MKRVLFVCTGNTCRSCMAEGFFQYAVSKDETLKGQFSASSAGIYAFDGDTASANSIKVLMDHWGIDISAHRSRKVNVNDINSADIILTMTREHKNALISMFPEAKSKVFTLKEYVRNTDPDRDMEEYDYSMDILDPYGMPVHVYEKCAEEIKDAVEKLMEKLKKDS